MHPADPNHQQIVCNKDGNDASWRWTRQRLVDEATRAGGSFTAPRRNSTDC